MKTLEERSESMADLRERLNALMAARAPQPVSVPLHISPRDQSDAAIHRRYELHTRMMALNPQGWPQAPGGKPAHRKKARKAPGVAVGVAAKYGKRLSENAA